VLPAASFAEKEGTFTNTERRIQRINPALAPVGESRPDWQILIEVAQRTAKDKAWVERQFHFHSPADGMAEISRSAGIYGGVSYDRLTEPEGLQWPIVDANDPGAGTLYSGGFERGKGKLTPAKFDSELVSPTADLPFVCITGRTPLWNTGAI